MTVEEENTGVRAMFAALEPATEYKATGPLPIADRAALSSAISLRRIADALERLAAPPAFKALTDDQRAALSAAIYGAPASPFVPYGAPPNVFPWQGWPGGELPPVPGDVRVEVRFRDGDMSGDTGMAAFAWQWRHAGHPRDIVAWRLAK